MSEREGSQVAQSVGSSSKDYIGESPPRSVVRVSINVSEHDHQLATACSPAISGVPAQQVRLDIVAGGNEGRLSPAAELDGHSGEYIASPEAHQHPVPLSNSPTDHLQPQESSPEHVSRSPQAAGNWEDTNAASSQPRYPASPPGHPETSPVLVLTSPTSLPSAQQCPSPRSSAHFDTPECATATSVCLCAQLLRICMHCRNVQCQLVLLQGSTGILFRTLEMNMTYDKCMQIL